ncbi:hypothetical protein L208DRAFT_1054826, partial [Tricholoma matsutake]
GESGVFSQVVYNSAATEIAKHHTSGAPKTGKSCKSKWTALKSTYNTIQIYQNGSGFHWDNENGAKIEGEAADKVWQSYIRTKMHFPFHNKGWHWLSKFKSILP